MTKKVYFVAFLIISFFFVSSENLPAENWKRVVQAEEILNKIKEGKAVVYDAVLIKGSLNVEKIRLKTAEVRGRQLKVIYSRIEITTSTIEEPVEFPNALFQDEVDFKGTVFESPVSFRGSYFRGKDPKGSKNQAHEPVGRVYRFHVRCQDDPRMSRRHGIEGGVLVLEVANGSPPDKAGLRVGDFVVELNGEKIKGCQHLHDLMGDTASIDPVTIKVLRDSEELKLTTTLVDVTSWGAADFDSLFEFLINGDCFSFSRAHFKEAAIFNDCCFEKAVGFVETQFDKRSYFAGTIYTEDVDFGGCYFNWPTFFNDAYFVQEAEFAHAKFQQGAGFVRSYFNAVANFASARIKEGISFEGTAFKGTVNFSWIDCEKMLIDWSQIKGKSKYDKAAYAFLRRNFENLGKSEDADGAYYEYRNRKRRFMKWYNPQKLQDLLLELSCGYGTKPFRAVRFSLGLILLFSLCFWKDGAIKEKSKEAPSNGKGQRLKRFGNALYFSVNTFTTVGYGDWVPTEERLIKLKGIKLFKFRHIAMVEGFLGWVVLSLFLITLARTWIR